MSEAPLRISDIQLNSIAGNNFLQATVDGEEIFLQVPSDIPLFFSAEFFIGVALLEAMFTNRVIEVDQSCPVSDCLLRRLSEIQSIYRCWNSDLNIIPIEANRRTPSLTEFQHVGSFYSGGVDSAHTLMHNRMQITHLIMFNCFDYDNSDGVWEPRVKEKTSYAKSIGKIFCPVKTNAREWTSKRKISWEFAHGLMLSSVGSALGMRQVYIPSSHSYSQLFPWGTHPLTDPMWSTELTEVIHHGAHCDRGQKIKELVKGEFVDNLQVCWKTTGENCGKCSKCVRTMVAFHLLNAQTKSLPSLNNINDLRILKATDIGLVSQLEDMLRLAAETGNDRVYQRLFRLYRKYQLGCMLGVVDRYLLGSLLKKIHRKFKSPEWLTWRVTLTGDNEFGA